MTAVLAKPKGDVINRLTREEMAAAVPRFNGEIAAPFVPAMSKAGPWPSILRCEATRNIATKKAP